jgi:hypothetical protein
VNIGIIVYSRTGNTLAVAEKLLAACRALGHNAVIERVTALNEDPNDRTVDIKSAPDPSAYDAVMFGAPVQAFSLSPIMKTYLEKLPVRGGQKACCFVTQQLSKPWLGGTRAVRQICGICRSKGFEIAETGIVNWSSKSRESQISQVVSKLSRTV